MLVKLHRPLFVGGVRYRPVNNLPVEIPEEFRNQLPKDAEILPEPELVSVEKKSKKAALEI